MSTHRPDPVELAKYQALGNDYLVIDEAKWNGLVTESLVRRICDRRQGAGADGVLVHMKKEGTGEFRLRIINPDGSEAEKSGNGLRIYARYLSDLGLVSDVPFQVVTAGGVVTCKVDGGESVTVEMGQVSFSSRDIPVSGPCREVIGESMEIDGRTLEYCAATIGNPHCVISVAETSPQQAQTLGPRIELDTRFPNRTNVQFLQVIDSANIRIEIWERGAGYTLASGTSSCAAAAVAHRLGLCGQSITVHMPGGRLHIEISPEFAATLSGPVSKVADFTLTPEFFRSVPA